MIKQRKVLSLVLVIAMVISMFAMAIPASAEETANGEFIGLLGDVDQSSKIDVKDATLLQKYLADLETLTEDQQLLANVDGNKLNVTDVTWIQKYVAEYDCSALGIGLGVFRPVQPTEPVTTEPVTTEPVTTEPATTEPVTTEPATTEPATTEPVTTEPETTEPQGDTKTIYFDNSLTQWDTVALYQWTDGTTCIKLEPVEGTDNIFSAVVSVNVTKGLFKNLDSTTEWDQKTADVDVPGDGMIFVPDSGENKTGGSWSSYGTEPTEPVTTEPVTTEPTTTEPTTTEPTTTDPEETTAPTTTEPTPTEPGEEVKVSFDASAIIEGNEQFAVWAWPDGTNGEWYTVTDEGNGIYSVVVPSNYNVIFARMDANQEIGWDAKWTQTDTLTIDGTLYTITGQVEGTDQLLGHWNEVDPTEPVTTTPVTTEPEETTAPTTTEPQPDSKTLYFDNSITQWDIVVLYQWTDGTTCIKFEPVEGADNIYSAQVSLKVTKGLFKNLDSTSDWDQQTADIDVPGTGMMFVPDSSNNKTGGSWVEYKAPEPTTTEPVTTEPVSTSPVTDPSEPPTSEPPVEDVKVSFNASAIIEGNEQFAVWAWVDGSLGQWYTVTDEGNGIYSVVLPSNCNVIFARMDATQEIGWDAKWTQTDNLTIDGTLYTITGQVEGTDKLLGSWNEVGPTEPSTEPTDPTDPTDPQPTDPQPTEPETTAPVTDASPDEPTTTEPTPETVKVSFNAAAIIEGNEQFAVWAWANGSSGEWYTVTDEGDGVYSVELPADYNVIFARMDATQEIGWDAKWTQTDNLTIDGTVYTITGQVEGTDKLVGSWNSDVTEPETTAPVTTEPETTAPETTVPVTDPEETTTPVTEPETTTPAPETVKVSFNAAAIIEGNEQFAVWAWADGVDSQWYELTNEGDGVYSVELPSNYSVIFVRMDALQEIGWPAKWTQTANLTIDGAVYTITGQVEGTDRLVGSWDTEETEPVTTEPETTTEPVTEPETTTEPVTEPETTTEPVTEPETTTTPVTEPETTTPAPETVKVSFNAAAIIEGNEQFAVWAWADGVDSQWYELTNEGNGVYSVELPSNYSVIFVRMDALQEIGWPAKWTQTANLTIDGAVYTITGQVEGTDRLVGSWDTEETEPVTTEPATTEPATTEPATTEPVTTEPQTTDPQPETKTIYIKTSVSWIPSDGAVINVVDADTGVVYDVTVVSAASPYVWSVELPETVTNITIQRCNPATMSAWNSWTTTVGADNCYTMTGNNAGSWGEYVEEAPAATLATVYFDNSASQWSAVYIHGWGASGLSKPTAMTQIEGTDIWYYTFSTPVAVGDTCFMFVGSNTSWDNKTKDLAAVDGKNMYVAPSAKGSSGTWDGTWAEYTA